MTVEQQEAYDKLLRCTGMMQGAYSIVEQACPNSALFDVWNAAREAVHRATVEMWGAAIKMMPTDSARTEPK